MITTTTCWRRKIMRYFSFDLSFTGTGICMLDDNMKIISFWQVKTFLEKLKTFENIQIAITSVLQDIEYILADYEKLNEMKIIMEQPFVGGCWSAGLYGLDSAFYQRWRQFIVRSYHPNTLKKVMGQHTKKDSRLLAQDILADLEDCGWRTDAPSLKGTLVRTYRITDDQAEALIYNTLFHVEEKHPDFIEMYESLNCEKIFKQFKE